jgi:REP element-mobilizing transposase RayT
MHIEPKYEYRRNLPHYQKSDRAHFITFTTADNWILPYKARDIALETCVGLDGKKIELHAAVVMPNHVHLAFTPLRDANGNEFRLAEILHALKSYTAHEINKRLKRKGHVWLDESFDHVLRSDESLEARIEYIRQNPVRRGLVKFPSNYRWLWIEGDNPASINFK